jgi:hypothetical protein
MTWAAVPRRLPPILALSAGFVGGSAMAIYTPLTLVINLRHLPAPCRPGWPRIAVLAALSAIYGVFAIVASAQLLLRLLG